MSRSLIATAAWIAFVAAASNVRAQNYLPAVDSGYNNYYSFSSAGDYIYTASVGNDGLYAGISSTVDSGPGNLGSTAELTAGSNDSGSPTTVSMSWRDRATTETMPGCPSSPLPIGAGYLASDVVNLQGVNGIFALQMSYSPGVESAADAAYDGPHGDLYLGWFDPANQKWRNAANRSLSLGPDSKGPFQGSFADFWSQQPSDAQLPSYLGDWGVDIDDHTAWAVLDGLNGQFAVVPEPGTMAMVAAGALAFLPLLWRRRKLILNCLTRKATPSTALVTP
jgi:hypothetical protein